MINDKMNMLNFNKFPFIHESDINTICHNHIKIELEISNSCSFMPGENIQGGMILKYLPFRENPNHMEIVLELEGSEKLLNKKGIFNINNLNLISEYTWHKEKFNLPIILKYKKGEFYQPFSIKLDSHLPPTIYVEHLYTISKFKWSINAYIKAYFPEKNMNSTYRVIKIESNFVEIFIKNKSQFFSLNGIEKQFIYYSKKIFNLLRQGRIKFIIACPKNVYKNGQEIDCNFIVDNTECGEDISEISIYLIMKITQKYEEINTEKNIVLNKFVKNCENNKLIPSGTITNFNASLKIPSDPSLVNFFATTYFGKLIEISFAIRFEVFLNRLNFFDGVSKFFCSFISSKKNYNFMAEVPIKIIQNYENYRENLLTHFIDNQRFNIEKNNKLFIKQHAHFEMKNVNYHTYGLEKEDKEEISKKPTLVFLYNSYTSAQEFSLMNNKRIIKNLSLLEIEEESPSPSKRKTSWRGKN